MNEEELLKRIGKRIKDLRIERGIEQQVLAAEIDYEKSNMSRLESGKLNLKIATLYKVAKALEVTLSEMLAIE